MGFGCKLVVDKVGGEKVDYIMIDKELLDLMICPLTGDKLRLEGDKLINEKWGVKYPICNGIPIMLLERAELPEGVNSIEELKAKTKAEKESLKVEG